MRVRPVLAVALGVLSAVSLDVSLASAAAPSISRIEPPSWWVGHSLNPVRLLLYGSGLSGARVAVAGEGLTVGTAQVDAAGHHLFVDVNIDPHAKPGSREIRITTPGGSTETSFEVLAPVVREGRFQGFSSDDVLYLLMPDRFANGDTSNDAPPKSPGLLDRSKGRYYHGGDLRGVIEHLPYLKELGVTALWMTPLYDNNDRLNERERYDNAPITDYHGYGAVDLYAVDEHLGDLDTLRSLVQAAHHLGLKVIQDQVANHVGPYHPWVTDPPTPTWWNGTEKRHLKNPWQTWTLMDPHASPELQQATLQGWFIDLLPDLNQDDPEVRRYLIQNALWWVGSAGFDGIRQDTLPYVPRSFWHDWSAALKLEYSDLKIVGEMWDGDPVLVSSFQAAAVPRADAIDTGIDTLFDFPLFGAVRKAFGEGGSLRELAKVLAHDRLYPEPGSLVVFLGLHDVPRFVSEPGQSREGLAEAFTFLATTRGTPLIYYGDEIGMSGGGDPDNRRDFPGGWREDPQNAFTAAGRTPEQQALFEHVRRVLALRAKHPALRGGALTQLVAEDNAYAFARRTETEALLIVMSNATTQATVDVPVASLGLATGTRLTDLLGVAPACWVSEGRIRVVLPPRSAAILVPAVDGR
jgi:glycosidase